MPQHNSQSYWFKNDRWKLLKYVTVHIRDSDDIVVHKKVEDVEANLPILPSSSIFEEPKMTTDCIQRHLAHQSLDLEYRLSYKKKCATLHKKSHFAL